MKKDYKKPSAEKVVFDYVENVVACSWPTAPEQPQVPSGLHEFLETVHGIMIRQRYSGKPYLFRLFDNFRGSQCPIRGRTVAVQINLPQCSHILNCFH